MKSVEFNLGAGMRAYDFLAGDQLYKRELGDASSNLIWAAIQRPRWRFQVERQLKALRQSMSWFR